MSSLGTIGHGSGVGAGRPVDDRAAILRAWLRPHLARCGAPAGAVVAIEATGDEIVDVEVRGADAAAAACLAEAAWGLRLDGRFDDWRRRYRVTM